MKYFRNANAIKNLFLLALLVPAAGTASYAQKRQLKPRIVVLTDIAPNDHEPDDMESMVRLLVHADQFEIEALIATTGWNNTGGSERIDFIHDALNAYEKDLPNLKKRSDQERFTGDESRQQIGYWPAADYLRSRTVMGSTKMGMKFIGEGNDSKGSNLIIEMADENDDRPIWVSVWGGANTFAQAIWRVQQERTPEELKAFLNKFRVYTITDQDRPWSEGDTVSYAISAHQWIRKFEEDLLFLWCESAWKHQNGIGRSNWDDYALHIQKHGNLGAIYPKYKWGVEGDTPAFMHVMPNGLSDPDIPTQVSWSGYFEFGLSPDNLTHCYTNYTGEPYNIATAYFKYFYPAIFNNFAARMDWAKEGKGNRNPVIIINRDKGISPIEIACKTGKKIKLDASKTFDPDGDRLRYKWWVVPEAGTYSEKIEISNSESKIATIHIPSDSDGKKFHVICEVIDDGTHNLTSYRRIIFEPK
ncbi:uncharacterized protein DUF1593 [Anseongella ginsenosidimutans]|uniref:Uncharacterized protein DUF1593 n=1 Tax=Anseongella ginsenosidimutans TaxID=496056 RepID=A0A4R3KUS1_9SPHI|nr:DUF1593 domain-containing protein [Anseongella ginsenosidimutans]QEC53513.1 DUF1593 domain-containing protein [Anseongella ginsenosidimutans]TCS88415.1 uncharacterized protein DUF1593 [Anseongella ginsenosidimutans]